ncbi:AraC family transcriptional regulator [Flavobacterium sp.]|uniref:helix-turn-helix domain-containing protein n=1 Tax=Flavobacterium sp. TaxID=239 RepID=UPI002B4ADD4D|nr:AraC family transcriptional regulator [Flavobacterium sp.]HLF52625.1 AraC family transcriptional regulator [Flavobacterium sp.]
MKPENKNIKSLGILYSCYHQKSREGEQFVPEHVLIYQIAGSLILNDANKEYEAEEGSFYFIKRNQLLKFKKQPPVNGEFKSLSIYLNQETLKNFSMEYRVSYEKNQQDPDPVFHLKTNRFLKAYVNSLLEYHLNNISNNQQLLEVKLKEGLILLLETNPELKNFLFDFNEPHKINLEAFMNKNYHFNVHLERFAYLTGRSLATFKRDFEKIFHTTPRRWLQQKRLKEAYYLIKEKGKMATEIYHDLGFEDLSHFSYAFKKTFGESPSKIS